jgi:CheY-like chemotaxis protein
MTSRETHKTSCVLLVDDDDTIAAALTYFAKKLEMPLDFEYAAGIDEAIEKLNSQCFDCAILDVRLPGVTGASLGALVRERDVNIPLAYLTNLDTEAVRKEAIAQRAFFLSKIQFVGSDDGVCALLNIIREMAQLNPCLKRGERIDNHGYARTLPKTPIALPESLCVLLKHSNARAVAA